MQKTFANKIHFNYLITEALLSMTRAIFASPIQATTEYKSSILMAAFCVLLAHGVLVMQNSRVLRVSPSCPTATFWCVIVKITVCKFSKSEAMKKGQKGKQYSVLKSFPMNSRVIINIFFPYGYIVYTTYTLYLAYQNPIKYSITLRCKIIGTHIRTNFWLF